MAFIINVTMLKKQAGDPKTFTSEVEKKIFRRKMPYVHFTLLTKIHIFYL